MALLFAAPVWFALDDLKANLAFTALAASTGMLPDGDIVLMRYFFIEHHGLTHSLVFIVPTALVLGAIVAGIYLAVRDDHAYQASGRQVYGFVALGLFTGMLAHVFADLLTTPDIAPPLEPMYPLLRTPMLLDVAFVKSNLWNLGTLAVGITVQAALVVRSYYGDI
ncbi:membrane-bound metal-dependent hydrolase [Candidatus Halobonum tyrrellensis G22]|uniref:Membrane-bound metal-dependent hydrolase n=2 Tax=Candidatus Halobonum TaxID=1431544 RepID=V4IW83_9EURY|nr:membrane-bound metal-dependent hydrolase [Candidatus Halobonum tyrrellensis G22]